MARHDQVLVALRRIIRANDRYSRQLSKADGLTAPQLLILQAIAARGELTMGEIAQQVSLSQGTITSILDRLEKRGLLERRRDSADKRRVYANLTEAGRAATDHTPLPLQENFRRRFAELREADQSLILQSLEQVAAMMNPEDDTDYANAGPAPERDRPNQTRERG